MILFGGLLPWAVGMLLLGLYPATRQQLQITDKSLKSLGLIWLAAILLFFSIPTSKLIGYILPTVPAAALLLALALEQALQRSSTHAPNLRRWQTRITVMAIIGAILGLSSVFIFAAIDKKSHKNITLEVKPFITADARVVFYNYYYFSVPFYLNREEPALVTGAWDNPLNFKSDGAGTELYTSGQFDVAAAKEILIVPTTLDAMIKAANAGTEPPVWVFIHRDEAQTLPLFTGKHPRAQDKKTAIYCFGCAK
jgi:hypothetical protein